MKTQIQVRNHTTFAPISAAHGTNQLRPIRRRAVLSHRY
jgi:hypothetical protein